MSTLGEATNFSGATWRKSAKTQANGQCVEVARMGEIIGVRDSKDPSGPIPSVTRVGQPPLTWWPPPVRTGFQAFTHLSGVPCRRRLTKITPWGGPASRLGRCRQIATIDHGQTRLAHGSNPGAPGVHSGQILKRVWPAFPHARTLMMLRARRDSNP